MNSITAVVQIANIISSARLISNGSSFKMVLTEKYIIPDSIADDDFIQESHIIVPNKMQDTNTIRAPGGRIQYTLPDAHIYSAINIYSVIIGNIPAQPLVFGIFRVSII